MLCRICGESTCESDPSIKVCAQCCGLKDRSVSTPEGFGVVRQFRPTGGILVELAGGLFREFTRSQLALEGPIAKAPAPAPPPPAPIAKPAPAPAPVDLEAFAVSRLEELRREDELRLTRIWLAHRLSLRLRSFGGLEHAQSNR